MCIAIDFSLTFFIWFSVHFSFVETLFCTKCSECVVAMHNVCKRIVKMELLTVILKIADVIAPITLQYWQSDQGHYACSSLFCCFCVWHPFNARC